MNRLIVVGAGPAGLTLALQLARAGQAVTLLDARRDFSRSLRGDALMPCGLEAIARMGLWSLLTGLPQRALEGWSVWVEGQELFRVAEPMGALHPCRLVAQQHLLEALLQEALAQPTFNWMPGVTVSGLLEGDADPGQDPRVQGVRLVDGRELKADLVIGCDGRDSLVRRMAGLRLEKLGAPLELLWLVLPKRAATGECTPKGFFTLVAGGAIASACIGADGDLQLGWLLKPGESTPQRSASEWANAIAAIAPDELARLLLRQGHQLRQPQRFSVQVGVAERWQRPGMLLLGDAAHPMSPIRAQGINQALRDSWVAAQELLIALKETDQPPSVTPAEPPAGLCQQQLWWHLDQASLRIETRRRPEIQQLQRLQLAEAQQGHWIGHHALLRQVLAWTSPLSGRLAKTVWTARQRPLREGAVWL